MTVHRARHRDAILACSPNEAPKRRGWVVPELGIRFGAKDHRHRAQARTEGPVWLHLARMRSAERLMSETFDVDEESRPHRAAVAVVARPNDYVLTRFVFLRFLGLLYAVAFLVAANQLVPLVGSRGLEPAMLFLDNVKDSLGPNRKPSFGLPTLFWWSASDVASANRVLLRARAVARVALGLCNSVMLLGLWILYCRSSR